MRQKCDFFQAFTTLGSFTSVLFKMSSVNNISAVVGQFGCALYGYSKHGDVADCCADLQNYAAHVHKTITSVHQTVTDVLLL